MTKFTGTKYEGTAIKIFRNQGIFSAGLQPNASPDLIIPAYKIGIEIKSTISDRFYPSKNPTQYSYLKSQFARDWNGWDSYYMIYFLRSHQWKIYSILGSIPFRDIEGTDLDNFIRSIQESDPKKVSYSGRKKTIRE